jgi:subtilisin family serine protease
VKLNLQSFLIFTLLLAALPVAAQNEANNGHEVKGHQAILKIAAPAAVILDQIKQLGDADDFRPLSGALNLYVLHSKSENVAALLNSLKNHPSVVYVEPDYIVKTSVTPNDPGFPQQWSFLNTTTPGADIGATNAWAISTGSTTNIVGVVDTGMDYTHPDLAANVWSAPAPFTVTLSWGTLTCPAGSHGYNAITRSCAPMDDNGHGTHVSGTIGAVGNNATGVAGVNWTTRIMALKFLDSTGSGAVSDAIDGIEFALQAKTIFGNAANVRVFSNSWGGSGFSQGLLDEINKVNTANGLFVVAAGNSSQNDDTTPTYPASYAAPNLITVAATTGSDTLASFSNYGLTTVHLGAPGVNIVSTWPNSQYANLSGTSMATPHVSGAAMLVLSACNLSTAALKSTLLANVDSLASLAGITVTGGRLDVNKAIRSCSGGSSPPTGAAAFVKTDTTTAGTWKGVYGADGFNVVDNTASYPSYVTVTPSGISDYIWASSTADVRGLEKASATDRIAACWYSGSSFTVDLAFKDTATHQVAVYLLDWDVLGRTQRVDILDANNNVLDTRSAAGYSGGEYLVWNLSGHVILRFVNTTVSFNAVLSGIFFR